MLRKKKSVLRGRREASRGDAASRSSSGTCSATNSINHNDSTECQRQQGAVGSATPHKSVSFTPDTIDPPCAERCACCKHRNIIPQIREMDLCMECFNNTCSGCMTSMGICAECESDLFQTPRRRCTADNGAARFPKKETVQNEAECDE